MFRNIRQRTAEVVIPVAASTLIVTALRLIGGLQLLEWSALDFFFATRTPEPVDNRIVLVTLTEEDLQSYEESVISDRNLGALLKKINAQNPAIVGLDLYRDIKEESPQLSDEQNERAYQELQAIFRNTENLVGIQKALPPFVRPPKVLQEEGRVAAAEVVQDGDTFIRRGYFYPNLSEEKPILPGLGLMLAQGYLNVIEEIVGVPNDENWLTLGDVEFEPFEQNDGGYVWADNEDYQVEQNDGGYVWADEGYQVLVNWRQADFIEVSLTQVLSDQVAPDMFTNRIVLIGNVSSTGDRYYLPMSRWSGNPPEWFYGVEVHAQIASSILSAVLDGRPIMRVSPDWAEYGLIFLGALAITLVGHNYRSLSPLRLITLSGSLGIGIVVTLAATSYLAFFCGYWIPVVPAIAATGLAWVVSVICLYIIRLQQSLKAQVLYIDNMAHVLRNKLNPLKQYIGHSLDVNQDIQLWISTISHELATHAPSLNQEFFFGQKWPTEKLENALSLTEEQIQILEVVINSILEVAKLKYSPNELRWEEIDINQLTKDALNHVHLTKRYQIEPEIQEFYEALDPIAGVKASIEQALINLIDNAYDALIEQQTNRGEHDYPKITISTRKIKSHIEVVIEDNGIGIAENRQDIIFLPFSTSKLAGTGTGLGLYLAQKVAQTHNGSLRVQSQLGQGSRFSLRFSKR